MSMIYIVLALNYTYHSSHQGLQTLLLSANLHQNTPNLPRKNSCIFDISPSPGPPTSHLAAYILKIRILHVGRGVQDSGMKLS